jgi:hypothetical protein
MSEEGSVPAFKKCPKCEHVWSDRKQFLEDPELTLMGYQVNFGDLTAGLFLFNHIATTCGTTLALEAELFEDMHKGPMFEKRMTNSEACPGHCLKSTDLEPCPNNCECAYVRDVLDNVNHWPKAVGQRSSS